MESSWMCLGLELPAFILHYVYVESFFDFILHHWTLSDNSELKIFMKHVNVVNRYSRDNSTDEKPFSRHVSNV
jgi:hypothetical protein